MPAGAAFLAAAAATGAALTFAPIAGAQDAGTAPGLGLLLHPLATLLARGVTGRYGVQIGVARLLVLAVAVSALGIAALTVHAPAAVLAGMIVLGIGFGVAQNASLTAMFASVGPSGFDAASALWSIAYDGGLGLGSLLAVGLLVPVVPMDPARAPDWLALVGLGLVLALGFAAQAAFGIRKPSQTKE